MNLLTRDIPPRAAAAVVALALVASVVAGREKPSQELIEVQKPLQQKLENEAELDVDKLRRQLPQPGEADPFAPRSFAPAPKVAHAAPAKPTAPPLPFTYLGKVVDGGKTSIFVARGDENYSLEPGQTIGGTYRVDRITDSDVTFTYLPMKTRQTLRIPAGE
ncbi:MAG TPA: hypothetical protein VHN19_01740 [Burkholderiales bacterium]|nr:hypothetical protein [Burkholderiales bacterium]